MGNNQKSFGLKIQYSNVFTRNLSAYKDQSVRNIINQGGSSSGKTYSIIQILIYICITERKKVSVVSSSVDHLKKGTMEYFLTIMNEWEYYVDKRFNRSDRVYTFPNGSVIEFISGSEPHKLKGPRRDILYINEADNIPEDSWLQLIVRTNDKAFIDYNPSRNDCWIYPLSDNKESRVIRSNYQDNTFLNPSIIRELNSKRDGDPNWYRSFVLGLRPNGDDRIYKHFTQYDIEATEKDPIVDIIYGLDWGYTDPTAMVEVKRTSSGKYYVRELIYETNLVISDLLKILSTMDIKGTIYCDSANPDKIKDLRLAGYDSRGSNKSIKPGIDSIRESPIFIHSSSTNLWKEQAGYVWQKIGSKLIDTPKPNIPDHLLDALRYAVHTSKYRSMAAPEIFIY